MTYRISKYSHNNWKEPNKFKNPMVLGRLRFSWKFISISFCFSVICIVSFRYFAIKLIDENLYLREWVIFYFISFIFILFLLFLIKYNMQLISVFF
jgi:hypothetical protein